MSPCARAVWLFLLLPIGQAQAETMGTLKNGNRLGANATICLSVGLMAEITGLEDFRLTPEDGGISGASGTSFSGKGSFRLMSNGAVTVLASGSDLVNGSHHLTPVLRFDEGMPQLTTADGAHDGLHDIQVRARSGNISRQKAGQYAGSVTLTVTPAIGGLNGCGAFSAFYPRKESWSVLAWEDLYPSAGDKDYNDSVIAMRVVEDYNAQQQLTHVSLDFVPLARGAGYDHALMLSLDGVVSGSSSITTKTTPAVLGAARVTVTETELVSGQFSQRFYGATDNITVFGSTFKALGSGYGNVYENQPAIEPRINVRVDIDIADPGLNPASRGLAVDDFLYRPYLKVLNTGKDIDLYQLNQGDRMITPDGYAFGLVMPTEWAWPAERVSIDQAYPYFAQYRSWLLGRTPVLSAQAAEWYNYPAASNLVIEPTALLP